MLRFFKILAFAVIFPISSATFAQDYSKLIGSSVCSISKGNWTISKSIGLQEFSSDVSGSITVYGFVDDFKNSKFKILVNKLKFVVLTTSNPYVVKPLTVYFDDIASIDSISYVKGHYVWEDATNYTTSCR